jgi:hypothetical protein
MSRLIPQLWIRLSLATALTLGLGVAAVAVDSWQLWAAFAGGVVAVAQNLLALRRQVR